jgi:hypothetical protein
MAKKQPRRRSAPVPREKHAWHVITGTGADHTIKAHACDHYDGVLTFRDIIEPYGDHPDTILVRAFGQGLWAECELVPVELSETRPIDKG